jgi:glycine hydroxymethyltransferase
MDEIFQLISEERKRQETTLQMIPSENWTSSEVRQAVGSVLMHKYSEGQPGKRYYQGNLVVDQVERLCKERALKAFKLDPEEWGINVQALSGAAANLAVYNALVELGERMMGMYLYDGGHLSHGWQYGGKKVTLASKIWDVAFYHVDPKTQVFDYDEIENQVNEVRPKLIISGGTAYPREIDHKRMGEIAHAIGAYYMADIAHEAGLVAGGANKSPFPYADVVTMTTHKTLRGPRGALIFSRKNFQLPISNIPIDLSSLIDRSVFPGLQGGPHNESIAGIAVCLAEALTSEFKNYTQQIIKNTQTLAKVFSDVGLELVSGGTDKHLILLDLRKQNVSGWVAAWALEMAGIVVNRNTVPNETASPFYPSGLRMGTPYITTRGMKEKEMRVIGEWIIEIIQYCQKWILPKDKIERKEFIKKFRKEITTDKFLEDYLKKVNELCERFPLGD